MVKVRNSTSSLVLFRIDSERSHITETESKHATADEQSSKDKTSFDVNLSGKLKGEAVEGLVGAGGGASVGVAGSGEHSAHNADSASGSTRTKQEWNEFTKAGFQTLEPGEEKDQHVPGGKDEFFFSVVVDGFAPNTNISYLASEVVVLEIRPTSVRRIAPARRRVIHAHTLSLQLEADRSKYVSRDTVDRVGVPHMAKVGRAPATLWIRSVDGSAIENDSTVNLQLAAHPKDGTDPCVLYSGLAGQVGWDQAWSSTQTVQHKRQQWRITKGRWASDLAGFPANERSSIHYGDNVTFTNEQYPTLKLQTKGDVLVAAAPEKFWIVLEA